jgi:hypothetical protein
MNLKDNQVKLTCKAPTSKHSLPSSSRLQVNPPLSILNKRKKNPLFSLTTCFDFSFRICSPSPSHHVIQFLDYSPCFYPSLSHKLQLAAALLSVLISSPLVCSFVVFHKKREINIFMRPTFPELLYSLV